MQFTRDVGVDLIMVLLCDRVMDGWGREKQLQTIEKRREGCENCSYFGVQVQNDFPSLPSRKSKEGRVSRGQERTRKTINFKSNPKRSIINIQNRQLDNNDSIIHDKKECK